MQVKSKSGWVFELASPLEGAKIRKGIVADPDTYELTDEELVQQRPVGRPKAEKAKEPVTIRLSMEVTALFRAIRKVRSIASVASRTRCARGQIHVRKAQLPCRYSLYKLSQKSSLEPFLFPVFSCYEAGRDGFWLHHYLVSCGINNQVLEPSSIKIDRRRRRAKTDRLDVERMLMQLLRYLDADTEELHVVRVPTPEQEDGRRLHREQLRLKDERKAHRTRINALLITQGISLKVCSDFRERLEQLAGWDGSALGTDLKAELEREYARLELVESQLRILEAEQQRRLEQFQVPQMQAILHLMGLRGIGRTGAWILVMEFFGWRDLNNRREVASAAGLTGTPYDSGDSEHEQGISKAGNVRIRWLIVQLAWDWLRYQPESQLSLWFRERFGEGKRLRRIGIVALARRLLIALWRYLDQGVVPEGAQLKAS